MKLVDALGTIYIAEHFESDVSGLLEQTDELDIAGARLTPSISTLLNLAIGRGKNIYDSEDAERQAILEENKKCYNFSQETEELPRLKDISELVPFLKDLSPDKVYTVSGEASYYVPLVTLIQYFRPEIDVVVDMSIRQVFAYVEEILYRKNFEEVIKTTDEFIMLGPDSVSRKVTVTEKDVNTNFELYGIGKIDWYTLRAKHLILPSYFGGIKIHKSEFKELWEPLKKRAMADLDKYISFSHQSIKKFLEEVDS